MNGLMRHKHGCDEIVLIKDYRVSKTNIIYRDWIDVMNKSWLLHDLKVWMRKIASFITNDDPSSKLTPSWISIQHLIQIS